MNAVAEKKIQLLGGPQDSLEITSMAVHNSRITIPRDIQVEGDPEPKMVGIRFDVYVRNACRPNRARYSHSEPMVKAGEA